MGRTKVNILAGSIHEFVTYFQSIASLGTGAVTAYTVYAGVAAFGSASMGASIASLSGIAAKNATLAWLGGGSLAAGGTLVLDGLVAGPALAVGGIIMSAQAKKKLNAAYGNLEQAKVVVEQFKNIEVGLETVHRRAEQLQALLKRADRLLQNGVIELKNIIHTTGTNWRHYSPKEKQKVHEVVLTAQLTKKIIDTPLLDEDGALTNAS